MRVFGLLVLVLASAAFVSSCNTIPAKEFVLPPNSSEKDIKEEHGSIRAKYKATLKGKEVLVIKTNSRDPEGLWSGSLSLHQTSVSGAGTTALSAFGHAKMIGRISGDYGPRSDAISISAVFVVTGARATAGSFCASFAGKSPPGQNEQVILGTFTVLGGTGPAAQLRLSGTFLSVQPKARGKTADPISLKITAAAKAASLGPPRGLPPKCIAATKPVQPPAQTPVSATLGGYAFAPAGLKTLPPGAQVFPDGSSIDGAVGCGQALYMVVDYSGPAAARATGGFYGPQSATIDQPVAQGQNALLLLASPPNGAYSLKLSVLAGTTGTSLGGNLNLSRTC